MSQKIVPFLSVLALSWSLTGADARATELDKETVCVEIANQVGSITTQQRGAIEENDRDNAKSLDSQRKQLIRLYRKNACNPRDLTQLRQSMTCQDLEHQLEKLAKGLVDGTDAEVRQIQGFMDPIRKKYIARCMRSRRG